MHATVSKHCATVFSVRCSACGYMCAETHSCWPFLLLCLLLSHPCPLTSKHTQAATSGNWTALLAAAPVIAVTSSSTLEQVIEVLAVKGLHRVYVVDAAKKPLSIITLTDVLRLVTRNETKPAEQRTVEMEEDSDDEDDE